MNNLLAGVLPQEGGLDSISSWKYSAAVYLCGLLTLAGVAFGVHSIVVGHEHTFGVTREVPWGILIAAYVFFVVTSTGLCMVSSIGHVFGFKNFNPIAKRAVFLSIATIVAGFLVIAFEIENSWRMPVGNVIGANPTSNIWWMGTLYGAYLFFMMIEFVMLQKNQHRNATMFGLAGLLTGIVAHSNLGAVFGLLNGREFWHGPYMPIYFITSAAMSGCVAIIFFTYLAYRANNWKMSDDMKHSLESVAKLGALMMAVILFFTSWKMITGITGNPPGKYTAMMALLNGEYSLNFWLGEVALGMVIPFALILAVKGRNMPVLFIASLAGMIGIFFMRYDLVIIGQLVPHYHGMGLVDYPELFTYAPTFHEWMVTLGGIGFCGFLFLAGERLFRGHLSDDH
ncbi:MAG: NrfD/PsrC family molybdoenzyme membrane anchor subunit [Desulfocapsaceae bacterium]|jgi:molybdopterin-containing oxidoreductase family membrane subunit|nr:NrfD/PsrC family molybdoenzyme membrane anchor subunit [Desulfocapsaceae bacterium]